MELRETLRDLTQHEKTGVKTKQKDKTEKGETNSASVKLLLVKSKRKFLSHLQEIRNHSFCYQQSNSSSVASTKIPGNITDPANLILCEQITFTSIQVTRDTLFYIHLVST